jgi:hypothetical protein
VLSWASLWKRVVCLINTAACLSRPVQFQERRMTHAWYRVAGNFTANSQLKVCFLPYARAGHPMSWLNAVLLHSRIRCSRQISEPWIITDSLSKPSCGISSRVSSIFSVCYAARVLHHGRTFGAILYFVRIHTFRTKKVVILHIMQCKWKWQTCEEK